MNTRSKSLLIFILFSCVFLLHMDVRAQSDREKKLRNLAEKSYEKGDVQEARKSYLQLLTLSPNTYEYNYKTGICIFISPTEKAKSLAYFEKAEKENKDSIAEVYYYLGMSYHYNHKFDEALGSFQKFFELTKGRSIGKKLISDINRRIEQCQYGKWLYAKPQNVSIHNLGKNINSPADDYAPVLSIDESKLVFTSKRKGQIGGLLDEYGIPYEDVFYSIRNPSSKDKQVHLNSNDIPDYALAKRLSKEINTQFHDAAIALTTNGNKLYLYQNQNLFMYYTNWKKWEKPVKIPAGINKRDDQPGMCITDDEKTIYFVSDRKGGFGGKDIYKIEKKEDGTWTNPENLGSKINSKFNEEAPNISADGNTLIFSSEGHDGMGGYDFFKSELKYGHWDAPQNLGYPLNTAFDELYFIPNSDWSHAYFSSSRDAGWGDLDLYDVNITEMYPTPLSDTLPIQKKFASADAKSNIFIPGTPKKAEMVSENLTNTPPPDVDIKKEATSNPIPEKIQTPKTDIVQNAIIPADQQKDAEIKNPEAKSNLELHPNTISTEIAAKEESKPGIIENTDSINTNPKKETPVTPNPNRLFYVQFAAAINPITPEKIHEEDVKFFRGANGYYKYLIGGFSDSLEAISQKKKLIEKGYIGPFVLSANPSSVNDFKASKKEINKTKAPAETNIIKEKAEIISKKDTAISSPQQAFKIEPNIVYSILIGSYRKGIPVDLIDAYLSIKDVFVEAQDSMTNYYTGNFEKKEEATGRQKEVISKGFKDARMITFGKATPAVATKEEPTIATKVGRNIHYNRTPTTNTPSVETPELLINAPIKKQPTSSAPEVIYKVQIGAFRENVPTDILNLYISLKDVEKENAGNPITVYTSGSFKKYPEAEAHRNELIQKGIANPFVVPYNHGVRITMSEALELTK